MLLKITTKPKSAVYVPYDLANYVAILYDYMYIDFYPFLYNIGWISANSYSCTIQSAANSPFASKKVQCRFEYFQHASGKIVIHITD